jgi:RNA polymerase sigma-70 factor (ECF subfamily)
MLVDPTNVADNREIAAASLHAFMRLPVTQRSCVILMDVLGYSLQEIGEVIDGSVPAVKAALNRGRTRLRQLAQEPDDRPPPVLTEPQRSVRLELVNKSRMNGKSEVGRYFGNYALAHDWLLVPGFVDRRPAILVRDPSDASAAPTYFVLLDWAGDRLSRIRDFRHARYAIDGAEIISAA